MPERWDRLVAAVGEASAMERDEAATYLQATLGDVPDLLQEAREILAGGIDSDEFLSDGSNGTPRPAPVLADGATFGAFRVRRLLGRGGMGAVFLADQAYPKRAVALKILESPLLSEKARARFEYEVQALARLRHAGIAQIHEAGVQRLDDGLLDRDVPWFAMEYVEDATNLLEYASTNELSTRKRLGLLLQVCDAVQHGHQKGVVHRDLKPDNILVDGAGRPKVIDFGVARGTEAEQALTQHTGASEILGTLPYLSPERVTAGAAAADVRTDVYALGVVLYQLLTGTLPIDVDANDIVTSARRICEVTPPTPSTHDSALPRDLDAITLKALAKDPAERYASTDALADDIRRFLEHRPINAQTPGVWRQLRLFARRHRALVTSGAIVLLVGIAATIVSVNWALESKRSAQQATKEKAEAVAQRSKAEQLFETVFKRSFQATIRQAPKLHEMPGAAPRVKAMMNAVIEDLKQLEEMSGNEPRVTVLIAAAYLQLGDTQGNKVFANLGDPAAAEASYRHGFALCDAIVKEKPDYWDGRMIRAKARIRIADILDQRERALLVRRKEDPALRKERRDQLTLAVAELSALFEEDPKDVGPKTHLIDVHSRLNRLALDEHAYDVALEHAAAIEKLYEDGHIETPEVGWELRAWTHHRAKDWNKAYAAWLRVAEETKKKATLPGATFEVRVKYASEVGILGECAFLSRRQVEAIEIMERAVVLFEALAIEAPDDKRIFIRTQIHMSELARQYRVRAKEDPDHKAKWLEKGRAIVNKALALLGPDEDDTRHRAGMRRMLKRELEQLAD